MYHAFYKIKFVPILIQYFCNLNATYQKKLEIGIALN